jgi:hypothetical protein
MQNFPVFTCPHAHFQEPAGAGAEAGAAGRDTILCRFSQEAMVKRTGQLYLDLVR